MHHFDKSSKQKYIIFIWFQLIIKKHVPPKPDHNDLNPVPGMFEDEEMILYIFFKLNRALIFV